MKDTFFHHRLNETERTSETNLQSWSNEPDFPADALLEDDHYFTSKEDELWQSGYNGSACDRTSAFAGNEPATEQYCKFKLEQRVVISVNCLVDRHDCYIYDDRERRAARGEDPLTLPPRSPHSNSALTAMENSTCMQSSPGEVFRGACLTIYNNKSMSVHTKLQLDSSTRFPPQRSKLCKQFRLRKRDSH